MKTMKKILLIVLMVGAYFFADAQTKTIWTCPMHPQIQKSGPGSCPICGMTLVKKTVKVAKPKPAPKNREVVKPNANVPKKNEMNDMDMKKDKLMNMEMPMTEHKMEMDSSAEDVADQSPGKVYIVPAKTVRYDLYVRDTIVNFTGKKKHAVAINGSIPAPTLTFTEGDTAEIYLHNGLKEETSLHWHGVILPNQADGVPYLTTAPIHPGETHLYKFKIVQNGTYWYHSHSALQEQVGMYGALLFKKREEAQNDQMYMNHPSMSMSPSTPMTSNNNLFDKEYTVVLSEWADENPMQIQRRLRTANDWFSIKKGSTQSYAEAIKEGYFKTKLVNEWKRMKAMDVSDVYYNRFLLNGRPAFKAPEFKAGDKVKLKVVNAGASSYFWLGYAGGKITVVGNDGNDVVPVEVDRLIIAPAETYDLVVTIPESMSYELRATSEDRTGYSSLWLGSGHQMPALTLPRLKYFEGMKMMNDMMNINGRMKDMGMMMSNQKMDMNSVMYPELMNSEESGSDSSRQMDHSGHDISNMQGMNMAPSPLGKARDGALVTLNYDMLRSPVKTSLPEGPVRTLQFTLTGNMNRYVWTLDNKTVTESDRIMIKKGEVLKLILTNNSMMRHPMHLHGHDFRVLNSQLEYSPLKNVIDVMPMETDTIEFAANQSGNWFFHCHILFHMMAGMGRVFTYTNSTTNPELPNADETYKKFLHHPDQNMRHLMIHAGLESNGTDGEAMLSSNRYALQGLWHLGYSPHHGYEGEVAFGRYLGKNQWWYPYVGFDYHYKKEDGDLKDAKDYKNMFGQVSNKNDRKTFTVGVQYTMPWLLLADARLDGDGKLRFQLSREDIPVTSRLRFNFMGNTDKEYMIGFRYIMSKWLALSTHYDSDMGLGAGITLTY
jgi:CopA family copper-resistance protein